MHESLKLLTFVVATVCGLLSIGFASQGSSGDSLSNDASVCFIPYLSLADTTKDSPELIQNTSSAVSPVDSAGKKISGIADSLQKKVSDVAGDSVKVLTWRDSLMAKSLDSTARLKYFHYQRKDVPYTQFTPKKRSKFFVYPSQALLFRTVQLDSTGNFVIIKEKIGNDPYKILLKIPLDEYIKLKLQAKNRTLLEEIAYKYELKSSVRDIGALISDITNIDIPLPSVGFLSIFGKKGINIRINGAVDIHGAWRNETTEGVTASLLGNSRNEPDFKQQVQINVQGSIGDKLKIGADWNTERTFEYENQLKLSYTGYEDEIVQKIEAGNVSLQTSPLVGGSEALFGIKANFQIGPLNLTTLASQKKGEIKEVSITGGSTTQEFTRRVYEYSTSHYFIDAPYAEGSTGLNLFNRYYGNAQPDIDTRYLVKEIEVWKSVIGLPQPGVERQAIAIISLEPHSKGNLAYNNERETMDTAKSGRVEVGRFVRLQPDIDYVLHPETGFLTFKTQIQEQDVIAVAYRRANDLGSSNPDDDYFFGEFVGSDTSSTNKLVLKLVKPQNLQPQYKEAWKLQLRNIYAIGGRGVNQEGFKLDIQYQLPGSEPQIELITQTGSVPLLNAFGLDLVGAGNSAGKDGNFDFLIGRTIIPETGEIIFPTLQPFGVNLPAALGGNDSLKFQAVYDTSANIAKNQGSRDRFVIKGKYSASSSSVFNLGMVGIVENSVKVTLGGRELTPNVDYVVDYNIGQVTIRNKDALVPGADLKISYEQNDIFQLASKTLTGARGEFNFSKRTLLGFSALNLNQQTLSDKVRIGEEPLNNSIYGVDFSTGFDMPFLTKGLDKLITTREMSSLAVKGEFAYINPDPNTKKSTIESDVSRSIAYVDDFEGSKKTIPLSLGYTAWHDISVPAKMNNISGSSLLQQMNYKAKSWWYNITPPVTDVKQIWPKKVVAKNDQNVTVLDYVFDPARKGFYNYNQNMTASGNNWGGIMKNLSSTASNLIDENIEFIEFWVQLDENTPLDAKLNIDLGKISEDVIPNGVLNYEDRNRNGAIDQGEDVGTDGDADAAEPDYSPSNPDPAGDNFHLDPANISYENINGTEGNSVSIESGKLPDTEDLNGNWTLDQLNSYYRYTIPLDTNAVKNKYIIGGGNTDGHWHLIRIPLKEPTSQEGTPSLSVVETIRLWVNGTNQKVHLRFADFNLVGSQWQKVIPKNIISANAVDSTLELSVISIEENTPEYSSPPGVERERDRSNTTETVLRNEQSLSLTIYNLVENDERQVVKYLRAMDLFNYSEMKLFVHGDVDTLNYNLSRSGAGEVYFRFGSDTSNYYEYRLPVQPGWNELSIPFKEITGLKQTKDTSKVYSLEVPGRPGHFYRLRGNPALTGVSFFMFGVQNSNKSGNYPNGISGKVWLDELRVIGADNTSGWAYSASTNFKLADLMTVNFNMSQTDPFFHRLSDKFGSRMDAKNWGLNVDLDVIKLMPFSMPGSKLRINYSHNESITKPRYVPGTDIEVSSASKLFQEKLLSSGYSSKSAQDSTDIFVANTQSLSISETWSLSNIELRIPSDFWLINETVNNLRFNFSFNRANGKNPTQKVTRNWTWSFGAGYALTFGQNNFFYPADIPVLGTILQLFSDYRNTKFYYSPQNLNMNMSASRNYSYSLSRQENVTANIARDFKAGRNGSFTWKLTEGGFLNLTLGYNADVASSLAHLLTINNTVERSEKEIWNDIFSGVFFGRDYQYSQSFDIRTAPKLPGIWGLNNFLQINTGYGVNYSWSNNFQQKEAGRSAGFSNKISFGGKVKLKSLVEPIFRESKPDEKSAPKTETNSTGRTSHSRGGIREEDNVQNSPANRNTAKADSLQVNDSTNAAAFKKDSVISTQPQTSKLLLAWSVVKNTLRYVLFDYDNISFNFSEDNTVQKSGIFGEGNGIMNFWGVTQSVNNGPNRLFMLGLNQDPGPRAYIRDSLGTGARLQLGDNFSQRNNFDFSTSRPLWEGTQLDIKWKAGWSVNKNATIQTDELGNTRIISITSTGSLTRSFVALPQVFFLSFLGKSGITKVKELYSPAADNLSDAFAKGFETMPLLSKLPFLSSVARYIPRPNWNLNWDGLEKYPVLRSFSKRVSLSHSYSSEYSEGWNLNADRKQVTQSQKISYGFQPLIGLTMTFNSLWNGNLTGNIKYSTKNGYDLGISTKNITESFSKDIGITASYSKSGFDIPLFGVNLKNDIEITVTYTNARTSVVIFNMNDFKESGTPQDGTVRTTLEPRIKYVISSRVTASVFYRRTSVQPEGAARITPTTTSEVGLDVHLAIQ